MDDVHARLQRAKIDWAARLEDFTSRISHQDRSTISRTLQNPLTPLTPFRVLLHLFAYEDVLDNGKLDIVFDIDDGASMTFFVPQLLSFLLHGALYTSPKLEEWILSKCRRNAHFAHRCYWFLRAWCLAAPVEPVMRSRVNSSNNLNGLTPFLDEPTSPDHTPSCDRKSLRAHKAASETFLPEEREMIERLMFQIKECGELSAKALQFGPLLDDSSHVHSNQITPVHSNHNSPLSGDDSFVSCESAIAYGNAVEGVVVNHNGFHGLNKSPSDFMNSVEQGIIPIDPSTGFPSVRHLDIVSAHRRYGFLPLDKGESRLGGEGLRNSSPQDRGSSETEQFDKTSQFVDALLFLADDLFRVPSEHRKEELRKQLQIIECELLPSNAIYVPIGNMHHRVWRICPDESIPIGTKERVPCIISLEVVDYTLHAPLKPRAWSLLDRVPTPGRRTHHRSTSHDSEDQTISPRLDWRGAIEGIELTDMKSEQETVNEWRFSRRDPHRRSSLFDKMTYSMKGPMEKMTSQMRDGLYQLRERNTSDELRSLTLTETFTGSWLRTESNVTKTNGIEPTKVDDDVGCIHEDDDLEQGSVEDDDAFHDAKESLVPPMSPNNSNTSLTSMGQWSSPLARDPRMMSCPPSTPSNQSVRQRGSPDRGLERSDSAQLLYGSDGEETVKLNSSDKKEHKTGHDTSSLTPISTHRPPVVFRESWQAKEDRVRQKSAFGSHSGWRLLPVLVKANDDLRQEQLASQLIYRMAVILAREKVPVWLCPYDIIALTESGGIIEAIPDTISLDSLKKNDPNYQGLKYFFIQHYGTGTEELADAEANFVESLAAYSMVCYILQLKDRHNGNILLDNRGHIIHIDFGFFFLSSPGSNVGFESAPFKLTRDFVELLGGTGSRLFRVYRELCVRTFLTLRRHCHEIILMVEMIKTGNEELNCFRGRPDEAIRQLRERFRLDLNDRACKEYVNFLIDESVSNWRTDWYDRYQRYFVGVL
jgi:hypothetical protein